MVAALPRRRSSLLLALALFASCGGGAAVDPGPEKTNGSGEGNHASDGLAKFELLKGLERRVLDNGLVVLVKEDHRLPIASLVTAYRVGSIHEDRGLTGVSHFLEHMLFKGTDKLGRGDIDLMTYLAGGENNAYTTHDMTGYWFRISADKLEEFIALEADRMIQSRLDKKEFQNEKKVVFEEINRDLDDPWGRLQMAVERTVFRHSRYHHPILGWKKDLEALTRDQMAEFYRDSYRPNNAVVVIVGDVKAKDAFAMVERHFGAVKRGSTNLSAVGSEPPQTTERLVEIQTDKGVDRLLLAYRSHGVGSSSDYGLDLLSAILTNGKTARLNERLVSREKIAALGDVESVNEARRHVGLFSIHVELMPDARLDAAVKAVQEELDRLKSTPVSDRELQRAKNQVMADFLFQFESAYNLADYIGYYEALDAPNYLKSYLKTVSEFSAKDLMRVAKTVFERENRTVGLARKADEDKGGDKEKKKRRPGVRGQSAPKIEGVVEKRLANGLTLLVKERRDLPVFHLQAFTRAGSSHETMAGLANFVGEMLDEGVLEPGVGRGLTDQEIADRIDFIGGQLSTDSETISLKVLSRDRHITYDLFRDFLRHPSFPEERLERIREEILAEIEASEDDLQDRARRLFYQTAYGDHPRSRPAIGTRESVKAITRKDLFEHHRRYYRPSNIIIAAVGDVTPSEVIRELEQRFGGWKSGAVEFSASPVPKLPDKIQTVQDFAPSNQANIYIGHPGISRSHPDYVALTVAESIFCRSAGFTDRLSRAIREERGLAYSVGGVLTASSDEEPGPFLLYVGTRNDQRKEAIKTAMSELRRFVETGPTEKEVENARNHLARNVVFDWETSGGLAGYLIEVKRYNLGLDHGTRFVEALKGVTRDQVHEAVKRHLKPERVTIAVVGNVK